jgi:peptide/nickel transport system permease protein
MTSYIIRRLLLMVPLLLGVSVITFLIIQAAPGDPVSLMLAESRGGSQVSNEDIAALKAKYGLDKPLPLRYLDWLSQVVRGNFGRSLISGDSVRDIIFEALPNTIKLSGAALLLALLIGLPLGVLSAIRQYSFLDHALTFLAFLGISVPTFWLGLMLLIVFGVYLQWLPTFGMSTIAFQGGFFASTWDSFTHYVLPMTAIVLVRLAAYIRFQRSAMLEVIRQDYVRTARAKGMSERVVILTHAWRNSLLSIITLLGFTIVVLIEGSVVIEYIYNWPGIGLVSIQGVLNRDYNVVMAVVLLSGAAIAVGNLMADILYAVADPRVRYIR